MFESGGKKRPHEDLFVADEHGSILIVDADCSAGNEFQWHTLITKRFPHGDWNGNTFLIKRGVFLPSSEQHIQVAVLGKRISRGGRWLMPAPIRTVRCCAATAVKVSP